MAPSTSADTDPQGPRVRAKLFAYAPDVEERIARWQRATGVRVLGRIPIYHDRETGGDDEPV